MPTLQAPPHCPSDIAPSLREQPSFRSVNPLLSQQLYDKTIACYDRESPLDSPRHDLSSTPSTDEDENDDKSLPLPSSQKFKRKCSREWCDVTIEKVHRTEGSTCVSLDIYNLRLSSQCTPPGEPSSLPVTHVSDTWEEDQQLLRTAVDRMGNTKLHRCIIEKDDDGAMEVIGRATQFHDLDMQNKLGQTPLHAAVLHRRRRILRRLMCAGATLTVPDNDGNTPLHLACSLGYLEEVQHLVNVIYYTETLENKYMIPFCVVPQDLRLQNEDMLTCSDLAHDNGHSEIVDLLEEI